MGMSRYDGLRPELATQSHSERPLLRQESRYMNTISISPAGKGQVTAASSDGHGFLTSTPLCDGARYWLEKGICPDTTIMVVWSSGSSHWSVRSTIGQAAKLTVEPNTLGKPVFRFYRDRRETSGASPQSS
jgi:hypothetical protein